MRHPRPDRRGASGPRGVGGGPHAVRARPRPPGSRGDPGRPGVSALSRVLLGPAPVAELPGHAGAPPGRACRPLLSRGEGGRRRVHGRGRPEGRRKRLGGPEPQAGSHRCRIRQRESAVHDEDPMPPRGGSPSGSGTPAAASACSRPSSNVTKCSGRDGRRNATASASTPPAPGIRSGAKRSIASADRALGRRRQCLRRSNGHRADVVYGFPRRCRRPARPIPAIIRPVS